MYSKFSSLRPGKKQEVGSCILHNTAVILIIVADLHESEGGVGSMKKIRTQAAAAAAALSNVRIKPEWGCSVFFAKVNYCSSGKGKFSKKK